MSDSEYQELQNWLSYKMNNSPYNKSCSNYNSGWKEALLAVKSKIKEIHNTKKGDK